MHQCHIWISRTRPPPADISDEDDDVLYGLPSWLLTYRQRMAARGYSTQIDCDIALSGCDLRKYESGLD